LRCSPTKPYFDNAIHNARVTRTPGGTSTYQQIGTTVGHQVTPRHDQNIGLTSPQIEFFGINFGERGNVWNITITSDLPGSSYCIVQALNNTFCRCRIMGNVRGIVRAETRSGSMYWGPQVVASANQAPQVAESFLAIPRVDTRFRVWGDYFGTNDSALVVTLSTPNSQLVQCTRPFSIISNTNFFCSFNFLNAGTGPVILHNITTFNGTYTYNTTVGVLTGPQLLLVQFNSVLFISFSFPFLSFLFSHSLLLAPRSPSHRIHLQSFLLVFSYSSLHQ